MVLILILCNYYLLACFILQVYFLLLYLLPIYSFSRLLHFTQFKGTFDFRFWTFINVQFWDTKSRLGKILKKRLVTIML